MRDWVTWDTLQIEYYLIMKYAWDETAWDETCLYLLFKLLIKILERIFIKIIAFYTPTTHFPLSVTTGRLNCAWQQLTLIMKKILRAMMDIRNAWMNVFIVICSCFMFWQSTHRVRGRLLNQDWHSQRRVQVAECSHHKPKVNRGSGI